MGGDRHQAEGGEDDADIAGEVVVVRGDAGELRVGGLAEDSGQHEHGRQGEAEQADQDAGLASHQAQFECGEAHHGADAAQPRGRSGGLGVGVDVDGGHGVVSWVWVRWTKQSSSEGREMLRSRAGRPRATRCAPTWASSGPAPVTLTWGPWR